MGPESAWSERCGRARDAVVLRVAGLVAIPGGDPGLGPAPAHGDLVHRLHVAGDRRGTDLCAHRQREDDDHRPGRRDRGPSSSSRCRGPPLRPASPHVRPVRSRVQGRLGGHRPHRQGGPDPHQCEPAREVRQFRRTSRGLRDLLPAGQQPGPPRDGQDPGLRSGCRTHPAAPAARGPAHTRARRVPPGAAGPGRPFRLGPLLDPAGPGRSGSLGPARTARNWSSQWTCPGSRTARNGCKARPD